MFPSLLTCPGSIPGWDFKARMVSVLYLCLFPYTTAGSIFQDDIESLLTVLFTVKMPENCTDFKFLVGPRDLDVTIFKVLYPLSTKVPHASASPSSVTMQVHLHWPRVYPEAAAGSTHFRLSNVTHPQLSN